MKFIESIVIFSENKTKGQKPHQWGQSLRTRN